MPPTWRLPPRPHTSDPELPGLLLLTPRDPPLEDPLDPRARRSVQGSIPRATSSRPGLGSSLLTPLQKKMHPRRVHGVHEVPVGWHGETRFFPLATPTVHLLNGLKWAHLASNQGPTGYEPVALPTELWALLLQYPLGGKRGIRTFTSPEKS